MKKILILTAVLLAIINFNYVSADDTTKQEDIKYEIINTPQEEFKIEIVDNLGLSQNVKIFFSFLNNIFKFFGDIIVSIIYNRQIFYFSVG